MAKGWGTAAGWIADWIGNATDPVEQEEKLLNAREKIAKNKLTPDSARKLAAIDTKLVVVRRAIRRKAGRG